MFLKFLAVFHSKRFVSVFQAYVRSRIPDDHPGWEKDDTLLEELKEVEKTVGECSHDEQKFLLSQWKKPPEAGTVLLGIRTERTLTVLLFLGHHGSLLLYKRDVERSSYDSVKVNISIANSRGEFALLSSFRLHGVHRNPPRRKNLPECFRCPLLGDSWGKTALFVKITFFLYAQAEGQEIFDKAVCQKVVWNVKSDSPVHIFEPEPTTWGLPEILSAMIRWRIKRITEADVRQISEKLKHDVGVVLRASRPRSKSLFSKDKADPVILRSFEELMKIKGRRCLLVVVGHGNEYTGEIAGISSEKLKQLITQYECVVLLTCYGQKIAEQLSGIEKVVVIASDFVIRASSDDPLVRFAAFCCAIGYGYVYNVPDVQNFPMGKWLRSIQQGRMLIARTVDLKTEETRSWPQLYDWIAHKALTEGASARAILHSAGCVNVSAEILNSLCSPGGRFRPLLSAEGMRVMEKLRETLELEKSEGSKAGLTAADPCTYDRVICQGIGGQNGCLQSKDHVWAFECENGLVKLVAKDGLRWFRTGKEEVGGYLGETVDVGRFIKEGQSEDAESFDILLLVHAVQMDGSVYVRLNICSDLPRDCPYIHYDHEKIQVIC